MNGTTSQPTADPFLVLIVGDVEETRDGIETLLRADGYQVDSARDEDDAVARARRRHPGLILVSPNAHRADVVAMAMRIRERAELSDRVPIVIFCLESLGQGAEIDLGTCVHVTRPDNFDQLRLLMRRVLEPAVG